MITRSKQLAILTATVLTTTFAPAQAWQTPGLLLPPNRTRAVGSRLGKLQLIPAMKLALNSPGDSMVISLEGSGKIGTKGGGRTIEATLVRTEDAYEVRLSNKMSASLGLDVFKTVDFDLSAAEERAVVYEFRSLDATAVGLQAMALLQKIKVPQLLKLLYRQKELVKAAEVGLDGAMHAVRSTRYAMLAADRSYRALYRSYRFAGAQLHRVGRLIHAARSRVHWAHRRIGKLPWFLRGAARRVLSWAHRAFAAAARVHRHASNHYRFVGGRLRAAGQRLTHARKAYEAELRKMRWNRTALASLKHELGKLQAMIDEMQEPIAFTAARVVAIEYTVEGGAALEKSLRPSGVELANLGAGIASSATLSGKLRFDFREKTLSLCATVGVAVEGDLSALVGARGAASSELAIQATWVRQDGKFRFDRDQSGTTFGLDVEVLVAVGIGVTVESGAGRTVEVAMDWNAWDAIARKNPKLLHATTLDKVRHALIHATATVTVQDRWITGSRSSAGFDVGVMEVSIACNTHWNDEGRPFEATGNAAGVIRSLVSHIPDTGRLLRAAVR